MYEMVKCSGHRKPSYYTFFGNYCCVSYKRYIWTGHKKICGVDPCAALLINFSGVITTLVYTSGTVISKGFLTKSEGLIISLKKDKTDIL